MIRQMIGGAACTVIATSALAQTFATGDPRNVTTPTYPAVCQTLSAQFSTSARSSPPSSDDTTRIQNALNSCAGTGHSVVLASSGSNNAFYAGKLTVNGEGLVVNSGVTLEGSNSYSSQSELIDVIGTNSFIGGTGAIDGRGDLISGTPRLIQTSNANNFIAYQITLRQAAHPHLYIQGGSGATVYGITTLTPATRKNADGIDIDSITDVSVINSSIEAGDDGIAIITNATTAANNTIRKNRLYGTHGLSVGSQTFDGVTNVLFTGNYVYGVDHNGNAATDANAINIKTDIDCGGLVQQVTYQNTCITQAKHLIVVNANYGSCSGTKGTPQFKNIIVNGVKSQSSVSGAYTRIEGFNSSNLAQLYLANVSLDATAQSSDQDATVFLDNSNMTPSGTNVTTSTFTTSGSLPSCSF
jgi:polygalacturonase